MTAFLFREGDLELLVADRGQNCFVIVEDEFACGFVALAGEQGRLVEAVEMNLVSAVAVTRAGLQLVDHIGLAGGARQRRKQIGHVDDFAADPASRRARPANTKGTRTPPSQVVPLSPRNGEVPPSGHIY